MELKRDIDPLLLAEYSKPIFYPIALVYVDAPDGPLYLHSGAGNLAFQGQAWLGLGKLGKIEIPFETSGAVPEAAQLGIVAPVDMMMMEADDQRIRGRQVDIYACCTTTPGGRVLIGAPMRVFTGSMGKSTFAIDESRTQASFSVAIKSGQPARSGSQIAHSDEDQQAKYPGDTLFARVSNAAKWAASPKQWPAS